MSHQLRGEELCPPHPQDLRSQAGLAADVATGQGDSHLGPKDWLGWAPGTGCLPLQMDWPAQTGEGTARLPAARKGELTRYRRHAADGKSTRTASSCPASLACGPQTTREPAGGTYGFLQ